MGAALSFFLTPVVALSAFLALLYTLAVHLFMALGYRHLVRHWLLAAAAMAVGYALAFRANSQLPTVGDAHLIEASLVSLAVLILAGLKAKQPPSPEPA